MSAKQKPRRNDRRPKLGPGTSLIEFRRYYRWKSELTEFARRLGLSSHGSKPELVARIERRLRGLPQTRKAPRVAAKTVRDSDRPLSRSSRVVHYFSDDRTRAFFESEIGPRFHFTYHLNQFRLARARLTYGQLIDEWLAEEERRRHPGYEAPLAAHCKYNRFVRDYFADERNRGRSLRDASAAWNAVKHRPGDPRYRRALSRSRVGPPWS